ncbi:hypothetical protein [Vibrio mediterranei]|uniref:hypothetical protein n=1 Tax=Vibrio mediterranei TaxID=689 RepID=UPI004068CB8D
MAEYIFFFVMKCLPLVTGWLVVYYPLRFFIRDSHRRDCLLLGALSIACGDMLIRWQLEYGYTDTKTYVSYAFFGLAVYFIAMGASKFAKEYIAEKENKIEKEF